MNKEQVFSKSLQANKDFVDSLTSKQLEDLMRPFDNYEIEQCDIHFVSGSTEKEYIVELEKFEKTKQRLELDKVLIQSNRQPTGDVTIYDNILSTFDKYMLKYASTNIKIKTNELKPQIYKVMSYEIEIIN